MDTASIFRKKLLELNQKREAENKPLLSQKDVAVVIYQHSNIKSAAAAAQQLSSTLSGNRRPFNTDEIRVMRKLFNCTMDEFFPISNDLGIKINI